MKYALWISALVLLFYICSYVAVRMTGRLVVTRTDSGVEIFTPNYFTSRIRDINYTMLYFYYPLRLCEVFVIKNIPDGLGMG